jgi:hypothetical protein
MRRVFRMSARGFGIEQHEVGQLAQFDRARGIHRKIARWL